MANDFGKIVATALVAGALGGGITYGGVALFNRGDQSSSTVKNSEIVSKDNSGGSAKVSNMKVNLSSQSEDAFNATKNAVVSVINLQKEDSSDSSLGSLFGNSSSSSSKDKLETSSEGSGVIYKKSGDSAYIVTNNHVVEGSNALEIILSDGKKLSAKIVGKDSITDLAVIKVSSAEIKQVASFGNSDNIKVAEPVLAIGSPMGSEYATSVTQGIISAKKREVAQTNDNGQQIGNATVIQTDTAINPGNSGGPLINLAGQVIGINSMKLSEDSSGNSVEGMGFSIPSNEVVTIINQLIKDGKVTRPALGISYTDLSNISEDQQSSVLKLPKSVTKGVVVLKINSGAAAKGAGIKKYDVITAIDGTKVSDQSTVRDLLYKHKVGDSITITYYHNGKQKTGDAKLTKTTTNE